jgi:hypothetical protein
LILILMLLVGLASPPAAQQLTQQEARQAAEKIVLEFNRANQAKDAAANLYAAAASASEQQKLLDSIQLRALQSVGFWWPQAAWRKTVTGMFPCPITTFWNMGLKA